ncbi:MAG: hypothetical protein QM733_04485 [Ilumatobacteraceae bacterium]
MNRFRLLVEDAFPLGSRGIAVTGEFEGTIEDGETVQVLDKRRRLFCECTVLTDYNHDAPKLHMLLRGVDTRKIRKGWTVERSISPAGRGEVER